MRAEVSAWQHRFHQPLITAAGTFQERRGWCITIEHHQRHGTGEAAPLPGFSTEDHDSCGAALRRWAHAPNPEVLPTLPSARHAVQQALLALGEPHSSPELFEQPTTSVTVNALVRDADEAVSAVQHGYQTVKIKVGAAPLAEDIRRVAAIRHAVGPDIALRLDANACWTLPQAEVALHAFAPYSPQHVEQPVAAIADLARLRGILPLAADESMRSMNDLERLLRARAVDAVVLKPMLLGGLDRCVALGRLARQEGLDVWVTTSLDGSVARHGALLAACCIPGVLACGLATGHLLASDHGPALNLHLGTAWL